MTPIVFKESSDLVTVEDELKTFLSGLLKVLKVHFEDIPEIKSLQTSKNSLNVNKIRQANLVAKQKINFLKMKLKPEIL
jgi:hypothetical protein